MTTTPDQARQEVDRLEALVARWDHEAEDSQRELVDLEARRGAEILDAGDDGPERARELSGEIAGLREHVETARATAKAAGDQLVDARLAVHAAEARDLRQQATKKATEADAHEATARDLRDRLSAHEDLPDGAEWSATLTATSPSTGASTTVPARTMSERLREEAAEFRGRAFEQEELAEGRKINVPTSTIDGRRLYAELDDQPARKLAALRPARANA